MGYVLIAWFFAVFFVYLGLVLGKSLTFIMYILGTQFLGASPADNANNILLVPMLVVYGILFGRLSATENTGIGKGVQSCFLAGMTVGIGRIFPIAEHAAARWEMDWVLDYAIPLQTHEWALLAMALGLMTYYTLSE